MQQIRGSERIHPRKLDDEFRGGPRVVLHPMERKRVAARINVFIAQVSGRVVADRRCTDEGEFLGPFCAGLRRSFSDRLVTLAAREVANDVPSAGTCRRRRPPLARRSASSRPGLFAAYARGILLGRRVGPRRAGALPETASRARIREALLRVRIYAGVPRAWIVSALRRRSSPR